MARPVVMIWPHDKDNKYGHAALQTDKYHISFWPEKNLRNNRGQKSKAGSANFGCKGSIVFYHQYDAVLEEGREPNLLPIDTVTNEKINEWYEKFLQYNEIDRHEVTLETGQQIWGEF